MFDIAQGKRVLLDGSRYSERRNATQGVVTCLFDAVVFARGDVNMETVERATIQNSKLNAML